MTHLSPRRRVRHLAGATVALCVVFGATAASATAIIDIVVAATLKDLSVKLIKMAIHQVLDDNRGAIAYAAVPTDDDLQSDKDNWFGAAGPVNAFVFDQYGVADATANNSLFGKLVEADGEGVFYSEALLTWKGDVKLRKADAGFAFADEMPAPEDVLSARLMFDYATVFDIANGIGRNDVGHSGAFSTALAIDGSTVFSGGVATTLGGLPTFSGDMAAYAGQFATTTTSFSATRLSIGGSYSRAIDYASFYASPELSVSLSGTARDVAQGVPEPASWALLLCGFGLAGGALRRRRSMDLRLAA
jgi:PEP-CTERM motif